jgi:hypothetical protein
MIVNAGYDTVFKGGMLGVQASYQNKSVLEGLDTSLQPVWGTAWTAGVHYGNQHFNGKVVFFQERVDMSKKPDVFSAAGDYKLNSRFSVGGYGDYAQNMFPFNWTLGAHVGYVVSPYATLDGYVQHQAVSDAASNATPKIKDNTTGILALSVKV